MAERKLNNFSAPGHLLEMQRQGECVTGYSLGSRTTIPPLLNEEAKLALVAKAKIPPPKDPSMPDG